jgi:hypothetical protein
VSEIYPDSALVVGLMSDVGIIGIRIGDRSLPECELVESHGDDTGFLTCAQNARNTGFTGKASFAVMEVLYLNNPSNIRCEDPDLFPDFWW